MAFFFLSFFLFVLVFCGAYFQKKRASKMQSHKELEVPWSDLAQGVFDSDQAQKVDRLELALKTAVKKLDLCHGIVAQHENDSCTILKIYSRGYEKPQYLKLGHVFSSNMLFCGELGKNRDSLLIDFASLSEWRKHPAYQKLGWETYIGARAPLSHGSWITVGFFQSRPRSHLFSKTEKDFVYHLARWISANLQREIPASQHMEARAETLQ